MVEKQDDLPNESPTGDNMGEAPETDDGDVMEEVMNKLNEVIELVGGLAKANKAMLETQESRDDALAKKVGDSVGEAIKEAMKRPEDVHSKEDLPESGEKPKAGEDAENAEPQKKDEKKDPYDRGGQPPVQKENMEKGDTTDTPDPEGSDKEPMTKGEAEEFVDKVMKGGVTAAELEHTLYDFRKRQMDEMNKIRGV